MYSAITIFFVGLVLTFVIHEAGHLLAAHITHTPVSHLFIGHPAQPYFRLQVGQLQVYFSIWLFIASIKSHSQTVYQSRLVALGGPAINLVVALICGLTTRSLPQLLAQAYLNQLLTGPLYSSFVVALLTAFRQTLASFGPQSLIPFVTVFNLFAFLVSVIPFPGNDGHRILFPTRYLD